MSLLEDLKKLLSSYEKDEDETTTEEVEVVEKSDIEAQIQDIYKRLEALEKPSEEEPKIIKKEKKVIVEEEKPQTTKNYYELSGRDPATGLKL